MKIKLSKSQWEEMGKKAGWKKEAQGRMDRNEIEMYPSTGKVKNVPADVLIQTEHIQKMQKMLHAKPTWQRVPQSGTIFRCVR